MNVCKDAFDCTGELNVQGTVALSSATGGVPKACIANGVNAGCDLANLRNVFAFGLAETGNPPTCTNPANATVNTTVCAAEPTDGFELTPPQAIVIIYDRASPALGSRSARPASGSPLEQWRRAPPRTWCSMPRRH